MSDSHPFSFSVVIQPTLLSARLSKVRGKYHSPREWYVEDNLFAFVVDGQTKALDTVATHGNAAFRTLERLFRFGVGKRDDKVFIVPVFVDDTTSTGTCNFTGADEFPAVVILVGNVFTGIIGAVAVFYRSTAIPDR